MLVELREMKKRLAKLLATAREARALSEKVLHDATTTKHDIKEGKQ